MPGDEYIYAFSSCMFVYFSYASLDRLTREVNRTVLVDGNILQLKHRCPFSYYVHSCFMDNIKPSSHRDNSGDVSMMYSDFN